MVRCPYCGREGSDFRQVRESWRFNIYTVHRLECPKCGGVFNYYEGRTKSGKYVTFTITSRRG